MKLASSRDTKRTAETIESEITKLFNAMVYHGFLLSQIYLN
jgi:hypothetical protein